MLSALEFGIAMHGRYLDLDDVLQRKREEVARQTAEYDPDAPAG